MRTSSTAVSQAPITARKLRVELEAVEQWLSTHPNSGVDFPTLERMRVLPSPPAWSYVQSQLQTLRKAESGITPEALAQIDEAITAYFEAIRQNAEPLRESNLLRDRIEHLHRSIGPACDFQQPS